MRGKLIVLLALLMLAGGCSRSPTASGEPLITVEGRALSQDEARIALRLAIEDVEAYGMYVIDWDGEIEGVSSRDYIRREALALISEFHAIEKNAQALGLSLSEDERLDIAFMLDQEAEFMGGREEFDKLILEQYGSLELYRYYVYEIPYLHDKLSVELFSEEGAYAPSDSDLEAFYNENYINCAYILLSALDDDGYPLEGDELDRLISVAEALRKQAGDGSDFLELVAQHGQDYLMSAYPEGRPISKGMHGEEFDRALESLNSGEVSEVIYSDDALYVIKRFSENTEYFLENREEIYDDYVAYRFQTLITEWTSSLEVQASAGYENLDPLQYAPGVG